MKQEPTLEAGAFRLRPFGSADAAMAKAAGRDPLIPLITTVPAATDAPASAGAINAYLERQHSRTATGVGHSLAIARADDDVAVGQIGVFWDRHQRASIGYFVVRAERGQGAAASALAALSRWSLELPDVDRLELYIEPWNRASQAVAQRAGFQQEGLFRSWEYVGDQRRDMFMYSRLSRDDVVPVAVY